MGCSTDSQYRLLCWRVPARDLWPHQEDSKHHRISSTQACNKCTNREPPTTDSSSVFQKMSSYIWSRSSWNLSCTRNRARFWVRYLGSWDRCSHIYSYRRLGYSPPCIVCICPSLKMWGSWEIWDHMIRRYSGKCLQYICRIFSCLIPGIRRTFLHSS